MDYNVKPMIHRFQQNGMNIVMDVNSGIVHVVDDVTYKVLAYYNGTNRGMVLANLAKDYEEAELNEVMDDLDELIAKEELSISSSHTAVRVNTASLISSAVNRS